MTVETEPSGPSGPRDPDPPRWFPLGLAAVAAVGLVIRLAHAVRVVPFKQVGGDAFFYVEGARHLADGRGFVDPYDPTHLAPSAYHPPLYQVVLSIPARLGFDSIRDLQVVTCLLGTLTVVLVGLLARRVAGPRVGLVAAGLAAAYPFLWMADGLLMSETITATVTALVAVCAYRAIDRPGVATVAALGVACGLAALARGETLLLVALVGVPVALTRWRSVPRRTLAIRTGVLLIGFAVVVAPWLIRNARTFDGRVLISSNDGTTLFLANCDPTYDPGNPRYGSWDLGCGLGVKTDPDEGHAAGQLVDRALTYMGDHKDQVPGVVAARVGRVWGAYAPIQQAELDTIEDRRWGITVAGLVGYYLMLPFAAVGVVALRRRGRAVFPLLAPFVIVTVTAAVFYGVTRFRICAEPMLVVLAAVGLVRLLPGGPSLIDHGGRHLRASTDRGTDGGSAAATDDPPAAIDDDSIWSPDAATGAPIDRAAAG